MDKEKSMKKKLFIGGAYLVVALLLLIYVSYSAYRIKISATVQMPEALAQKASLYVEYNQATGSQVDPRGIMLSGLRPNEKAATYESMGYEAARDAGRAIRFSVSNAAFIDESGSPGSTRSKLAIQYKLQLDETGVVPLKCILVQICEDGQKKRYTVSTGEGYEQRTRTVKDGGGNDAVFVINNDKLRTDNFELYFGWDDAKGVYSSNDRKEIASVGIRAQITQSIPHVNASDIQVATPVNGYYTDVKPADASPAESR